jgi:dihydroorotate dehydrogenase electron transfer subunit
MLSKIGKRIENISILKKEVISGAHLYLECQTTSEPEIIPGQFIELLVENNPQVFLRRPFSVHDWDKQSKTLSLWIKIIGKGSRSLANMDVGNTLNIVYPLGNGFSLPSKGNVLLIGGGCGAAPLLYLSRMLNNMGITPDILLGAKNKSDIIFTDKYRQYGNVHIMTEDGSEGEKGLVTNHESIQHNLKSYSMLYVCGPEPMTRAIGKLAISSKIPCQVSLENLMACGIGACLCCIVKTDSGNVCTCIDGPVFYTTDLQEWIYK